MEQGFELKIATSIIIILVLLLVMVYSIAQARIRVLKAKAYAQGEGKYQIRPSYDTKTGEANGYYVACYYKTIVLPNGKRNTNPKWILVYEPITSPFKTKEEAIITGLKYFAATRDKIYEEFYRDEGECKLIC